jgi:hypothetical protein
MSSKFMSPEEFSSWSEKPGRTLAEIEAEAINQQAMLRDELIASSGNTFEEFQAAPQQGRDQMLEKGGEVWIHEDQQQEASEIASDSASQDAILREFCDRHPQHFPSQSNGDLFASEYATAFQEVNPGIPVFWELNAMEAVYDALVTAKAFEVERIYSR